MPELRNFADTIYGPLAGVDALDFRVITLAGEGTGARSRPSIEPGPGDLQFTLGSMFYEIDEVTGFVDRGSVSFSIGDSEPRLDLVVVSDAGYEVVRGTPAAFTPGTLTPTFPAESEWAGRVPVIGVYVPNAHNGPMTDAMWVWKGQKPRTRQLAPVVTMGGTDTTNDDAELDPTSGWELVRQARASLTDIEEGSELIGPMQFWCQDAKPGQVIEITPQFVIEHTDAAIADECRMTVVSVDEDGITIINYANRAEDLGVPGWTVWPPEAASTGTAHTHIRKHTPNGTCLFLVREEDIVHGQGVMLELAYDLPGSVSVGISSYNDVSEDTSPWITAEILDRDSVIHIVTEGQSLTNTPGGYLGENTVYAIALAKALRALGHKVVVSNIGWSGAAIDYRTPGAASQFNAYCMTYATNWLINIGAASDLLSGQNAASLFAEQEAHADLARANGFDKVFQVTLPASISKALYPGAYDVTRQAYNDLVTADGAKEAGDATKVFDAVIPLAAHPLQQSDTIAPYIISGDILAVHPNAAGLDIYTEVATPVLELFL